MEDIIREKDAEIVRLHGLLADVTRDRDQLKQQHRMQATMKSAAEHELSRLREVECLYGYLRTGGHYIVKIGNDQIFCGGHSMSPKYGPALDAAIREQLDRK